MKGKRKVLLALLVAVCMIFACGICGEAASDQTTAAQKDDTSKTGWFKKGKYRYYRKADGKLCKNETLKIEGSEYRFDKKGRMVTGYAKVNGEVRHYDEMTGVRTDARIKLKITERAGKTIYLKGGKNRYMVSKTEIAKMVYNKNGKKSSFSKLKKGVSVWVYHSGIIAESYPAQFMHIYKVVIA